MPCLCEYLPVEPYEARAGFRLLGSDMKSVGSRRSVVVVCISASQVATHTASPNVLVRERQAA